MRPPGLLPPTHAHVSHLAQLRKAQRTNLTRAERPEVERLLSQTEHFVFTALPMRDDPEILASAEAMREAGVWHLPFPVCTFEFEAEIQVNGKAPFPGRPDRFILICQERDDEPTVDYAFCRAQRHVWVRIPLENAPEFMAGYHDGARGLAPRAPDGMVEIGVDTGLGYSDPGSIAAACLVMLATRGIGRERWAGDRPVFKDRPEPRDAYTKVLVREASAEQGHSDAHGGSTERCRVRLHLRRGHIRHQPYGPRSDGKTRMIWIAPMLVGYAEEGTIEHTHYERRPRHEQHDHA